MAIEGGCYYGEIRYVSEHPAFPNTRRKASYNAIAGNAST